MKSVRYKPWIGSMYGDPDNEFGGIRVLVLGESHYGTKASDTPEKTIKVIKEKARVMKKPFYTNTVKLIYRFQRKGGVNSELRKKAWEQVAFYNFVQFLVSDKPRVRPSKNMWEQSVPAFLEVVEELNPDLILVLGKELAKNLPALPDNRKLCKVQHPSGGFSSQRWVPVFNQSLIELG